MVVDGPFISDRLSSEQRLWRSYVFVLWVRFVVMMLMLCTRMCQNNGGKSRFHDGRKQNVFRVPGTKSSPFQPAFPR
jgi:hypothetical protein